MVEDPGSPVPAFLVTVPAAVAIWLGTYLLYAALQFGPAELVLLAFYLVIGGVMYGLPLVAVVVACLAYPSFLLMRRLDRVSRPAVILVGALLGLLVRAAVILFLADPEARFVPIPVVIVAGMGAAVFWWALWTQPMGALRGRGTV